MTVRTRRIGALVALSVSLLALVAAPAAVAVPRTKTATIVAVETGDSDPGYPFSPHFKGRSTGPAFPAAAFNTTLTFYNCDVEIGFFSCDDISGPWSIANLDGSALRGTMSTGHFNTDPDFNHFSFSVVVTGGTGRFAGASGTGSFEVDRLYFPVDTLGGTFTVNLA